MRQRGIRQALGNTANGCSDAMGWESTGGSGELQAPEGVEDVIFLDFIISYTVYRGALAPRSVKTGVTLDVERGQEQACGFILAIPPSTAASGRDLAGRGRRLGRVGSGR